MILNFCNLFPVKVLLEYLSMEKSEVSYPAIDRALNLLKERLFHENVVTVENSVADIESNNNNISDSSSISAAYKNTSDYNLNTDSIKNISLINTVENKYQKPNLIDICRHQAMGIYYNAKQKNFHRQRSVIPKEVTQIIWYYYRKYLLTKLFQIWCEYRTKRVSFHRSIERSIKALQSRKRWRLLGIQPVEFVQKWGTLKLAELWDKRRIASNALLQWLQYCKTVRS